ncbi:MAG: hypothetical protein MJB14_06600, partial [Spirochaetes bacterium]|nr:hypothetical protein [Spirochaetota bacterium]
MAPKSKAEKEYLKKVMLYKNKVFCFTNEADQEGFDYFDSQDYIDRNPQFRAKLKNLFFCNGLKHFLGVLQIFGKHITKIMQGRKKCFTGLDDYLNELEETGQITRT